MTTRAVLTILGLGAALAGCSSVPAGTYFPLPTDPATLRISHALHRVAVAAADDPARYSFAFIQSRQAAAYSDEDATFYVTDGLARLPMPIVEAVLAHEVAHEVLGHIGSRRRLSLSLSAGFTALGAVLPGAGLLDLVVNPIAVRAFTRQQELEADLKAVEILRSLGYRTPRRALAEALRAVAAVTPRQKDGAGGLLSTHPSLDDRLAALEPLEPIARAPGAVLRK